MHQQPHHFWVGWIALCVSLNACGDAPPTSEWRLRFSDAALGQQSRFIEARILRGGCSGTEVVYHAEFAIDDPGPVPPALPAGTYGFVARARDEGCRWIAEGCSEVALPRDEPTEIELQGMAQVDACGGTVCSAGQCAVASTPLGINCNTKPLTGAVVEVSAGHKHTCARLDTGWVYCWGDNDSGQIGFDTSGSSVTRAQAVPNLCDAQALSAGGKHTCALRSDGSVWCWGSNRDGQLGRISPRAGANPVAAPVAGLGAAVAIAAGNDHTCAALNDGTVWCWGDNNSGQLGQGDSDSTMPLQVPTVVGASAVTAGGEHSCGVSSSTTWCWGRNAYGQLGAGQAGGDSDPVAVSNLPGARQVRAGVEHTCALDTTGKALCWGNGDNARLGTGLVGDFAVPTEVDSEDSFADIAPGEVSSCAVSTMQIAYCWGNNGQGQLGQGDLHSRSTPARLHALGTEVVDISTGVRHACAATAAGAYCWGRNGNGESGNGSTTNNEQSPVQVLGLP